MKAKLLDSKLHRIVRQGRFTTPADRNLFGPRIFFPGLIKAKEKRVANLLPFGEMIAGHTKAIAVYKKEAADAQNPALKSYAEQVLPVLQKHHPSLKRKGKLERKGREKHAGLH